MKKNQIKEVEYIFLSFLFFFFNDEEIIFFSIWETSLSRSPSLFPAQQPDALFFASSFSPFPGLPPPLSGHASVRAHLPAGPKLIRPVNACATVSDLRRMHDDKESAVDRGPPRTKATEERVEKTIPDALAAPLVLRPAGRHTHMPRRTCGERTERRGTSSAPRGDTEKRARRWRASASVPAVPFYKLCTGTAI